MAGMILWMTMLDKDMKTLTGPLWGESTGHQLHKGPVIWNFDAFFVVHFGKNGCSTNNQVTCELRHHDTHLTLLWCNKIWVTMLIFTIMAAIYYRVTPLHRQQSSWGQHGAHMGPVGPRLAPYWPHEPCYQGRFLITFHGCCLLW